MAELRSAVSATRHATKIPRERRKRFNTNTYIPLAYPAVCGIQRDAYFHDSILLNSNSSHTAIFNDLINKPTVMIEFVIELINVKMIANQTATHDIDTDYLLTIN